MTQNFKIRYDKWDIALAQCSNQYIINGQEDVFPELPMVDPSTILPDYLIKEALKKQ
jgi:hypothetical protein